MKNSFESKIKNLVNLLSPVQLIKPRKYVILIFILHLDLFANVLDISEKFFGYIQICFTKIRTLKCTW